jgi:SAM-dependent methyltransferase
VREPPTWLYPLLRCPTCRERLVYRFRQTDAAGVLEHAAGGCGASYPVIGGIPRLVVRGTQPGPVVAGFDDEWGRFRDVGTKDHGEVFERYFDVLPAKLLGSDQVALDAGCGAGRWAFEVSRRGPRVVALDLGQSIEIARANTDFERVACVQADVRALPLEQETVDWAYSLGVLHHTEQPDVALLDIVRTVRPGGRIVLYLYYALDDRDPLFRTIFRSVDLARRIVSRQHRAVVAAFATLVAVFVYWPLARLAAVLARVGARALATKVPLSFYRSLSFTTMRNDSVDRFGTQLERRYSRSEVIELMRGAGLVDIEISNAPPFWHGIGTKPA